MFQQLNNRHRLRSIILAFALGLLLTGTFVHAQGGGTLRIGMDAPVALDPALGSNDPEILFNRMIYDYLIDVKPDSTIAPNLATDWTISDDGLTYTFNLQQGVKFQDGSDFSSADVVWSFNRLKTVSSPAVNILGDFSVSAPDAKSVVFTLTKPNADFLYGVASHWSFIIKDQMDNPNVVADDGSLTSFNGTGPFMLTSYSSGDRAEFSRNPNYWKSGEPQLDTVEMIFSADSVSQVNSLIDGSLDYIFKIPPDQFDRLQNQTGITPLQRPTSQHPVIRLRADEGPGTDVNVRLAFKYATDRNALNQQLQEGRGTVGNNDPISPVYTQFFDSNIQNPTYDPQKACDLLKQAGHPDGLTMTLNTPDALGYSDLATLLQQQWAQGCIHVDIKVTPANVYYSGDQWTSVDLGITGWGARPSPQEFLIEAYRTGATYNESHWSDPQLDGLIDQAGQTADVTARAAIYAQISEIFNERGPIIIPWFAPMLGATRSTVQGLDMAPFPGLTDLRQVTVGQSS